MAYPVIGPIQHRNYYSETYVEYRVGYRQSRPYNLVTDYECNISSGVPPVNTHIGPNWAYTSVDLVDWTPWVNRCYDDFKSSVYQKAELGIAIATAEQSVSMISARARQLAEAARYLRRGQFRNFLRTLKVPSKRQTPPHKAFADNWLEYSYGWSPLIGDMVNATRALSEPIKSNWVRSRVGARFDKIVNQDISRDNWQAVTPYSYKDRILDYWEFTRAGIQMGAEIGIDNPNLHLAEQLGLTNPAVIVWDLIPYSFVIDQVVNVGQFLALGTDFLGLNVRNSYTTKRLVGRRVYSYRAYLHHWESRPDGSIILIEDEPSIRTGGGQFTATRRTTGLQTPSLTTSAPITGWRRALNDVSLLLKLLR